MQLIKQAKKCVPHKIKRFFKPEPPPDYSQRSFAQEGEDLVLAGLLSLQEKINYKGFYVDIGAHHPSKYSNTCYFYQRGWRGINIDAMPGSMSLFEAERPLDVNLEMAISDVEQVLTYYMFNEPALNGFSKDLALQRNNYKDFKVIAQQSITTVTLQSVLSNHLPENRLIDFLSVDVEGLDIAVLESNDWTRFRPRVVLVEDADVVVLDDLSKSRTVSYMKQQGYVPCCKTPLTLFFVEEAGIFASPLGLRLKT